MRAIDTNLRVRLIVRDDVSQAATAEEFVAPGAWLSHLVLAETLWVLDAVHERTPGQLAAAVEMLLNHEHLAIQDPDVVARALASFRRATHARVFGLPGAGLRWRQGNGKRPRKPLPGG